MLMALFSATPLLIRASLNPDKIHVISLTIFILSMILLYGASATYHALDLSEKTNCMLRKLDHMMIFVLIAGTYTPVCVIVLSGTVGILNTSSMVSIYGQPSGVAYPASKFAVNGITKSLARELGKDNIRVNAVAPGVTRTDMVAALPEEMIKPLIATIPLGRVGEPEDVANAFLYLASDLAGYVTGVILSVDGAART